MNEIKGGRLWNAALVLSAGLVGLIVWDQSHWWAGEPDMAFGFLAPIFCALILRRRWPILKRAVEAQAGSGARRLGGALGWAADAIALLMIAGGGLVLILGAWLRGDTNVPIPAFSLGTTLGALCVAWGLLFLCLPEPDRPLRVSNPLNDGRLAPLRLLIFPLAVWLITLRPLNLFQNALSGFLQTRIAVFAAGMFDLAGLPIVREGNVLVVPKGSIGIVEACSGIRSLTGCIFAGAFLGAAFFERLSPKLLLLACSVALAFVCNLIRSLILTYLCYRYGSAAIEGVWHDATAYAVLLGTSAGLIALVWIIKRMGRLQFGGRQGEAAP